MLIVVAKSLPEPPHLFDTSTARAFLASPSQGLTYNAGVWHHSVLTLVPTDFAVVEAQVPLIGSVRENCEIHRLKEEEQPFYTVEVRQ